MFLMIGRLNQGVAGSHVTPYMQGYAHQAMFELKRILDIYR